jgi:hypothetical protein
MSYSTPRLIHCQLPARHNADAVDTWRIIPAGNVTGIITRAAANEQAPIEMTSETCGIVRQATSLPTPLRQRLFQRLPRRVKIANLNGDLRQFDRLQLEVSWGDIPPSTMRKLHEFAACYAPQALLHGSKSIFLLDKQGLTHFIRLIDRLRASRDWLQPTLSGPWPPISFGEGCMSTDLV